MDLHLQNSWEYHPDESWAWSAYLTGSDLAKVKSVQYVLHPSFSHPVREVTDPASGFRLDSEAWGSFQLKAIVHTIDGQRLWLTHDMSLKTQPLKGRTDAA